jgi:ComF family protein
VSYLQFNKLETQELFMLENWEAFYTSINFNKINEKYKILSSIKFGNKKHHLNFLLNNVPFPDSFPVAFDFITYIPLSFRKYMNRGFNQSLVIAKALSRYYGVPIISIFRKTEGISQSQKSRKERVQSLFEPSFRLRKIKEDLQGKTLLLVDDIITTGATLSSCAHLLKEEYKIRMVGYSLFYTSRKKSYKDLLEKAVMAKEELE